MNIPEQRDSITQILEDLGFTEHHFVQGRASVADLFRPGQRCGIYVLHCSNGEYYAGQAVDVIRRYTQHRMTHTDIRKISFKRLTRDMLDDEERNVIWTLESQGVALRNIALASVPVGESDFDLVMPREEQERWLDGVCCESADGERFDDPALRRRYRLKYEKLMAMPDHERVLEVLREYRKVGIPCPKKSEVSFWSCSCLPASNPDFVVYARVNISLQEVLTIGSYRLEGVPLVSFHAALSPIEEVYGDSPEQFFEAYPALFADGEIYCSGGPDQFHFEVESFSDAINLMHDSLIAKCIRLFNMRLMRKGPCLNKASHCLALGDHILG